MLRIITVFSHCITTCGSLGPLVNNSRPIGSYPIRPLPFICRVAGYIIWSPPLLSWFQRFVCLNTLESFSNLTTPPDMTLNRSRTWTNFWRKIYQPVLHSAHHVDSSDTFLAQLQKILLTNIRRNLSSAGKVRSSANGGLIFRECIYFRQVSRIYLSFKTSVNWNNLYK